MPNDLIEILGQATFNKADLLQARYLATQGDADGASDRMMIVSREAWRIVTSPDYAGDIELADLD